VAHAVVIGSRIIQLLESAPQGQEEAVVADFLAGIKKVL
jgi:tryptophan synthase alpha subunit